MKVVVNRCFGGFGLSRAAVRRIAELQGRPCFFFAHDIVTRDYVPIQDDEDAHVWFAFDIPNPNEALYRKAEKDRDYRRENEDYARHAHDSSPRDRTDPLLVRVVEEMGEAAWGRFAQLEVVEIPDGIEWEIDEYDGTETIHEKHRSW